MADLWLLADLGGTNTRLGLATQDGLVAQSTKQFVNADFDAPEEVLQHYLADTGAQVKALCAGVAGPVRNGTAQLTNHVWHLDSAALAKATGAVHVVLLNDLQAQAYALDDLAQHDIQPLVAGSAEPDGARMVMGLGTGSNIAVAHRVGGALFVPASESGHTSLPFCEGDLGALCAHLSQRFAHLPYEAALSGPGLQNIWAWLGGGAQSPDAILQSTCLRGIQTRDLFLRLLGKVMGNLALTHLPTGGIYLIGGVARAVAPMLAQSEFLTEFCNRGPYRAIMENLPISLITDDSAALLGCARALRQTL